MYVVTFYSFKGGAGRSMALMNIAIEMAKSGNRVLVADFDLEAPGIETFNLPRPKSETRGVVDFVAAYLADRKAPEVADFVYQSAVQVGSSGELWIMPAGLQDPEYATRLNSINWRSLYAEQDGYLLFEDLKQQWQSFLDPDYVLIDSRTGHTDVGGICTRQLPDAVVCLFFPTEQNLQGLRNVVNRIRSEKEAPKEKNIRLLFVNSNIPDLDDEDQILEKRLSLFKDQLGYEHLAATIHHYNNLTLLNQVIFTLERPRSRLASEYRALLERIRRLNPEDRVGALDFLEDFRRLRRERYTRRPKRDAGDVEDRLQKIHEAHPDDGEILVRLADFRRHQGRLEEADVLLSEAITSGKSSSDVYLRRADIAQRLGNISLATNCMVSALNREDADFLDVRWAIRWLRDLEPDRLSEAETWPAIRALTDEEVAVMCKELLSSDKAALQISEALLLSRINTSKESNPSLETELLRNLLGQGRSDEAVRMIDDRATSPRDLDQADAFNFAMAMWAVERSPSNELLKRVVELDVKDTPRSRSPNYAQCLSIANWATGNAEGANEYLAAARQRIMAQRTPEFSCWRYRTVEPDDFVHDLEEISQLLKGEEVKPAFMIPNSTIDPDGEAHD
jgi:cellulose biosynthesis protein BcsQ